MYYQPNPYNPFPAQMRGTHCEFVEGEYVRFISIYSVKYDEERVAQDKKMGIYANCLVSEYLDLVKEELSEDNFYFIYKVESYKIERNLLPISDMWDFNTQIQEYEQFGFTNLDNLADFCQKRWGVSLDDFVRIEKTQLPQ